MKITRFWMKFKYNFAQLYSNCFWTPFYAVLAKVPFSAYWGITGRFCFWITLLKLESGTIWIKFLPSCVQLDPKCVKLCGAIHLFRANSIHVACSIITSTCFWIFLPLLEFYTPLRFVLLFHLNHWHRLPNVEIDFNVLYHFPYSDRSNLELKNFFFICQSHFQKIQFQN